MVTGTWPREFVAKPACEMCGRPMDCEHEVTQTPQEFLHAISDFALKHATTFRVLMLHMDASISRDDRRLPLIAQRMGISKQAVHKHCKRIATTFPSLSRIVLTTPKRGTRYQKEGCNGNGG